MNQTQSPPDQQLWSSVTPIVISFVSMLGTVFIAYIQKRLGTHVKDTKTQLSDLHEKHEELAKRSQGSGSQGFSGQESPSVHEERKENVI